VSRLRPRSLPSVVVLVAALAQLVGTNELVLSGTLPLVSRSHGHGHPVTLLAHEGHVDVVLHHEGETPAPSASLDAEPVHGEDHVLHVTGAELSAKRWQKGPRAAVAATAHAHPAAVPPAPIACAPRFRPSDALSLHHGLRSTVLRI
jgi:hypothetical protein